MAEAALYSLHVEQARRLRESMRRQLGEFYRYTIEDDVTEISLNPDGQVWVARLGKSMECVGTMRREAANTFIGTIASIVRLVINYDHPDLQCRLPLDGSRFQATVEPLTEGPVFSIRRHASNVFALAEYEERGIMTDIQRRAIEEAIDWRRNIMVTGGTESGKTTLLNAMIKRVGETSDHRLVVCEDTPELRIDAPNTVTMWTSKNRTMRDLVIISMRLRPDRIIVGESRDGAIIEVIKAMGTGHQGGFTTLHADNPRQALHRVEMLIREVSQDPLCERIAEAIQVIIHIEKINEYPYRRITSICDVVRYVDGDYELMPKA